MIKARMFVVNENTFEETKRSGIASVRIPFELVNDDENPDIVHKRASSHFISSLDSMMADLMQITKGDYIFFWCEKADYAYKSNIYGVYRALSEPFFAFDSEEDVMPFKIIIEEAYHFINPVSEYEVLNSPYIKDLLWNIRGKKICGKSRGNIQITKNEMEVLLNLLIAKNLDYTFTEPSDDRFVSFPLTLSNGKVVSGPLKIDYTKKGKKVSKPNDDELFKFDMNEYVHFDKNYKMYYEKTFEVIFNYEIREKNNCFFEQIGIRLDKILWYANYLPFSLDKTEMDYFIIESEDALLPSKAFVIEFKRNSIMEENDTHFYRAMLYARWANDELFEGSNVVKPIIICEDCPDFNHPLTPEEELFVEKCNLLEIETGLNTLPVEIYTCGFSSGKPVFIRKK